MDAKLFDKVMSQELSQEGLLIYLDSVRKGVDFWEPRFRELPRMMDVRLVIKTFMDFIGQSGGFNGVDHDGDVIISVMVQFVLAAMMARLQNNGEITAQEGDEIGQNIMTTIVAAMNARHAN